MCERIQRGSCDWQIPSNPEKLQLLLIPHLYSEAVQQQVSFLAPWAFVLLLSLLQHLLMFSVRHLQSFTLICSTLETS